MRTVQTLVKKLGLLFGLDNKINNSAQKKHNVHHTEITFRVTKENMQMFKSLNFTKGMIFIKLFIENQLICYRIEYNDIKNKRKIDDFVQNLEYKTIAINY